MDFIFSYFKMLLYFIFCIDNLNLVMVTPDLIKITRLRDCKPRYKFSLPSLNEIGQPSAGYYQQPFKSNPLG